MLRLQHLKKNGVLTAYVLKATDREGLLTLVWTAGVLQWFNRLHKVRQRGLTVLPSDAHHHYHLHNQQQRLRLSLLPPGSYDNQRGCGVASPFAPHPAALPFFKPAQWWGWVQSNSLTPPVPSFLILPIHLGEKNRGAAVVAENTRCQKHASVAVETLTVAGPRALHVPVGWTTQPPTLLSSLRPTFSSFLPFFLNITLPFPSIPHFQHFLQLCNYIVFNSERQNAFVKSQCLAVTFAAAAAAMVGGTHLQCFFFFLICSISVGEYRCEEVPEIKKKKKILHSKQPVNHIKSTADERKKNNKIHKFYFDGLTDV